MRRPFVGGNWKCNGSVNQVGSLVANLNQCKVPPTVDVVVSPTSLHLATVKQNIQKAIQVSAQNCSRTKQGAFTGEISADMLVDFGLSWTILGHSERRAIFGETDQVVGEKVQIAQAAGLSVIACIGETLEERKANVTMDVLTRQLQAIVANVKDWNRVVIAYEPVWAIGTGVTASPEQAQEVHKSIRQWLESKVGLKVASSVRIIYGGSVKGNNCEKLISNPDIDGFLVGGASLKIQEFSKIFSCPANISSRL